MVVNESSNQNHGARNYRSISWFYPSIDSRVLGANYNLELDEPSLIPYIHVNVVSHLTKTGDCLLVLAQKALIL